MWRVQNEWMCFILKTTQNSPLLLIEYSTLTGFVAKFQFFSPLVLENICAFSLKFITKYMVFSLSFQKKYLIFPESKQDSTIQPILKAVLKINNMKL